MTQKKLPDVSKKTKNQSKKVEETPEEVTENLEPEVTRNQAETDGASLDDAPPVDALKAAGLEAEPIEEEGEAVQVDGNGYVTIDGQKFLSKDMFFEAFMGAHFYGGMLLKLQSLMVVGQEKPEQTRPASDALYDVIKTNKFLQFIIKPSSDYYKLIVAVGAYGMVVAPPLLAELAAKREARREAEEAEAEHNEVTDIPEDKAAA